MKNIVHMIVALILLPIIGAVGYMVVEGWRFLDAIYMAMLAITTVGFQEVIPLTDYGKIYTMIYLVISLGVFLYSVANVGELAVSGELGSFLKRRSMKRGLADLKDHYIVCGCGRMGKNLCRQFEKKGDAFVVIENDEKIIEEIKHHGWLLIEGDATEDSCLEMAGIGRAKSLATTLNSDASNVYTVLSAKILNKEVKIVARASDDAAAKKMRQAGADRIVTPLEVGAQKMARMMINEKMEDMMELFSDKGHEIDVTLIKISENSSFAGKPLSEAGILDNGVMVVGIKRAEKLHMPPPAQLKIAFDDTLICVGEAALLSTIAEKA